MKTTRPPTATISLDEPFSPEAVTKITNYARSHRIPFKVAIQELRQKQAQRETTARQKF